ncbi:MAG: glycerophosphodiester phosphodiesterase [Candidatus Binatia bacterium]
MRFLDTSKPRLFAHRGASGRRPENTLESFAEGLDAGAELLELDVHATRDGQIVVLHDSTLDRTTDGAGPIRALSLSELRRLDAGYRFADDRAGFPYRGKGIRVPTLAEVFEAFPGTPLNIELKQDEPAIERGVIDLIERSGASERVLLAAAEDGIMKRIRAVAGGMLTSSAAGEVVAFIEAAEDDTYRHPGAALQVPPFYGDIELVTAGFVDVAHRRGVEVHVWTLNDPAEIDRLLDLGVDGLMSDFPERLVTAVRARGH